MRKLHQQVTWMEVLAGTEDAAEETITRDFLSQFKIQPLDKTVRNAR